ncbi:MAG: hypothetical protein IJI44_08025 [Erysipelotrichaceae bacterium]|nr:hypothetical protein [Erysipelotrichaceae bacterium]
MKKNLLVIGIILLIAAALCLGAGAFFHWAVMSVMDGSAGLYRRLFRLRNIFLLTGTGLSVSGLVCLVIRFFLKTDR